eukprot:11403_1
MFFWMDPNGHTSFTMITYFLWFISHIVVININNAQDAGFVQSDIDQMRGFFDNNIGVTGCNPGFVVASPSGGKTHNEGDPDYYYHWQRDGSITMLTAAFTTNNNFSNSTINSMYQNYVKWIVNVQNQTDPANNYCNVLGEPKFYCNGTVFDGGWCRPQNDGPATRAQALTFYANYLLDNNNKDYVSKYLYTPSTSTGSGTCNVTPQTAKKDCGHEGTNQKVCEANGCCWYPVHNQTFNVPWCYAKNGTGTSASGAIGNDLGYVIQAWQDNSGCDLWEEEKGMFFYTTMVQRNGLIYGSKLAQRLGDTATSKLWMDTANNMVSTINAFVNNGIIVDAPRQHDCSVILGSLYGSTPNIFNPDATALYPPTDATVLKTVNDTVSYWQSGVYPINGKGVPGTMIGRYADDTYPGCNSGGGSKGHAWILCSNALADYYYRTCNDIYFNGKDILSAEHLRIYSDLFRKDQGNDISMLLLKYSNEWNTYDDTMKHEISQIVGLTACTQGDNQLKGVANYVKQPCGNHMAEQICETNGKEDGAYDLTWAYGTVLSAWYYRELAINNIGMENVNEIYWPQTPTLDKMSAKYYGPAACGGCESQCSD